MLCYWLRPCCGRRLACVIEHWHVSQPCPPACPPPAGHPLSPPIREAAKPNIARRPVNSSVDCKVERHSRKQRQPVGTLCSSCASFAQSSNRLPAGQPTCRPPARRPRTLLSRGRPRSSLSLTALGSANSRGLLASVLAISRGSAASIGTAARWMAAEDVVGSACGTRGRQSLGFGPLVGKRMAAGCNSTPPGGWRLAPPFESLSSEVLSWTAIRGPRAPSKLPQPSNAGAAAGGRPGDGGNLAHVAPPRLPRP